MLRHHHVIRLFGISGALLLAVGTVACGGQPLNTQVDCGNGVLDSAEECDGVELGGAGCVSLGWEGGILACNASCTYDTDLCEGTGPECGNDAVEYGEECDGAELDGVACADLGFTGGTLACTSGCSFDTSGCSNAGTCGDETLDPGEECDGADLGAATCETLGWDSGALACDASCHYDVDSCEGVGPECGNSVVEGVEECDGTDMDSATCETLGWDGGTLGCTTGCLFDESSCADIEPMCGDDTINTTLEECDGADLGGETCVGLGWDGGTLACGTNCHFDESGCFTNQPYCGDGAINTMMEECDGGDLGGVTCADLGWDGGALGCSTNCHFDESGCFAVQPICGNGVANTPMEDCDGNDLDGETCQSLGFGGGMLSCSANCTFNTSNCWGSSQVCGDGMINQQWEECDTPDFGGEDCQSLGYAGGTLACDGNCQHDVSNCTGGPTCSDTGGTLSCNMAGTGTNVGAPDLVDDWFNCVGWPLTGPEVVYSFVQTGGVFFQNITVDVTGLSADLDLMILSSNNSSCDPALGCGNAHSENQGNNPEQVTFQYTPGTTYYIVVDGWDGATSSYDISVTCN